VDVQEERLLLGITPHQINFLTRLDSGKGTNNAEASYAENQAGFKKVLSQALEIGRKP
jgi:flagellar biogenesis protein FliO